jgi:ABC-type multidrug transport system ATPase subunit
VKPAEEPKPTAAKPTTDASATRDPAARTPAARTASARTTPARTAAARTAAARTAAARTAATRTASARTTKPAPAPKTPAPKTPTQTPAPTPKQAATTKPAAPIVLALTRLSKSFDEKHAVDDISLTVAAGSIFGIVGPNGAGKTTTLSMVTGLLRPDAGTIRVHGADVWTDPVVAKRNMGVLPDRLRLFDRLTGSQLLYYSGILRGLSDAAVKARSIDLANAFGLEDALDRLVADYSAGMTKKIALAAAMIHSPRLLVLDEPFESVDPVSAANVIEILQNYAAAGGTVVLSSHSMDLIQRICDSVAVVVDGRLLALGTVDEVRGVQTLEERFVELAGGRRSAEGMEWLHSFSD